MPPVTRSCRSSEKGDNGTMPMTRGPGQLPTPHPRQCRGRRTRTSGPLIQTGTLLWVPYPYILESRLTSVQLENFSSPFGMSFSHPVDLAMTLTRPL